MSYVKYTGLRTPNQIVEKISDYCKTAGWTVLCDCIPDLAIDGSGMYDGIRLSIESADKTVYASFRSANGKKIFQTQSGLGAVDSSGLNVAAYGIGLTAHTSFTSTPSSGYWYDQAEAPRVNGNGEIIGVGIAVANDEKDYTLYCNTIELPNPVLVVSVDDGTVFQHLVVGYLQKIGNWDGGIILSGSRNSYSMFVGSFDPLNIELASDRILCMNNKANTFLRIDLDNAPSRSNNVLWGSAGEQIATAEYAYTGKQIALSMKKDDSVNANVPCYTKLTSKSPLDTGRNCNTLNCITVNMNLMVYALRDPDALRNFSPVGYVPGIYFISMRNVASAQTYEVSYPTSGDLHQVFPYTRRYGMYGLDGFSVSQDTTTI